MGHSFVYYTTPAQPVASDSGVRAGRLTAEEIRGLGFPLGADAYVCGPESFMDDVVVALADNSSVLELAEACDVPTQWSCRTGVCHTCITAVLSGEASYGTTPLEPPGENELLICSVRPPADLVIDL